MKRILLLTILTAMAFAQPRTYPIQPAAGDRLELKVHKTGIYRGKVHVFSFPEYSGTLEYDAARPEASRIELTMKAAALKLEDKWLNEKDFKEVQRYALEDMLDARKHPEITFRSSSMRALDATHFQVDGMLFIRGAGRPATVKVTLDPAGSSSPAFSGSATVKMTAWGLKPPKAALGLVGTKDEMDFSFRLSSRP